MARIRPLWVSFTEPETEYADRTIMPPRGTKERALIDTIVNTVRCSFCGQDVGYQCVSRSNAVGTSKLTMPHKMRFLAYRRQGQRHPLVRDIGTGLGNDDRLMEKALDLEDAYEYGDFPSPFPVTLHAGESVTFETHGTITGRVENVVSRRVLLEKQAERALEALESLEIFGDDVYENETVLMVNYKHLEYSDKTYSYIAAKLDDRWYLTGYQNEGPRSWDKLVEQFLSHGEVTEVWMVTGWEQIL